MQTALILAISVLEPLAVYWTAVVPATYKAGRAPAPYTTSSTGDPEILE